MQAAHIIQALESTKGANILIIGDVMIDAYHRGKVNRISPEAPVPVLAVEERENRLGGAANVALNVQAMGARPILCSVIGADEGGKEVIKLMESLELETSGMVVSEDRITTLKTRMMSGHQQLLRVDQEETGELNHDLANGLLKKIEKLIRELSPRAIIFEDYDKGVLSHEVISRIINLARDHGIIVTVDPKKKNFFSYAGADLFKPNLRELKDGLGLPHIDTSQEGLDAVYSQLLDKMSMKAGLFTLASQGVYISDGSNSDRQPAHKRQIADVSGAGDTVISVATCALLAGLSLPEVAFVSNLAGGWVCQYPGVVSVQWPELRQEIENVLSKP